MSGAQVLDDLQALLARVNDVPVRLPVSDFHLAERAQCAALLGRALDAQVDEQVLFREDAGDAELCVYIDADVVARLQRRDPLQTLGEDNLADFCTAMEGVSHFQYLVWCIAHGRQLSLLELELQADVDKFAVAVCLLRQQGHADLPRGLHRRLFEDVGYVTDQTPEVRRRYEEANRHAARFCERLQRRHFGRRHFRFEAWLRALRDFYRRPHHQKLCLALQ